MSDKHQTNEADIIMLLSDKAREFMLKFNEDYIMERNFQRNNERNVPNLMISTNLYIKKFNSS